MCHQHQSHDRGLEACISVARVAFDHHPNLTLGIQAAWVTAWRLVSYPDVQVCYFIHIC